MNAAWTISSPAAKPASPRTATGRRPTPATSSTGISKMQETLPWLTGSAQWIFKDFTTPLRVENPIPRINQKGLIDRDMQKKEPTTSSSRTGPTRPWPTSTATPGPSAGARKAKRRWSRSTPTATRPSSSSTENPPASKQRNSQDFPAAGLRWMSPFVPGKNTLRVVATKAGKTVIDEITFLYQTETWSTPAELKLTEKSRTSIDGKENSHRRSKALRRKGRSLSRRPQSPTLHHRRPWHTHRQSRHHQSITRRRNVQWARPDHTASQQRQLGSSRHNGKTTHSLPHHPLAVDLLPPFVVIPQGSAFPHPLNKSSFRPKRTTVSPRCAQWRNPRICRCLHSCICVVVVATL